MPADTRNSNLVHPDLPQYFLGMRAERRSPCADARSVRIDGQAQQLQIRGLPEMPLEQLTFDDIHIDAKEAGAIVDAKDITLRDVHIETHGGSDVVVQRVERLYVEHSTGIAASSDASAGQ